MELAERKQKILSAVVENFIKTGEPVGSKTLIDETDLKVSSATVRNDMADLTQKGYLVQPHTSAGRIPTQQGYRYYVDNLMKIVAVSQRGRELVEDKLYRNAESPENILKSAADLLSELTGLTAVATAPNSAESRIHKISFVLWQNFGFVMLDTSLLGDSFGGSLIISRQHIQFDIRILHFFDSLYRCLFNFVGNSDYRKSLFTVCKPYNGFRLCAPFVRLLLQLVGNGNVVFG